MRILSCVYILTILFSIHTAESYFVEDFDNTYDQRDASILYIRQLLKRLRLNNDDNLRWRKRTDATPKKCQEILSGMGYRGETGPVIDNLDTYQDCMNVCETDSKCYGWSYRNSTKSCWLQTSLHTLYGDGLKNGGSCLGPAAKETACTEVLSGCYYYGNNGPTIKQVATYQDCMSKCDASATCMAWQYRASSQICQLLTTIQYNITDGQYITGSCIKQQAPYPPLPTPAPLPTISLETYRQQALDEHNLLRKKHCVPSLTLDPALNDIAQTYAQHLADTHTLVHSGNKFNGQWMGENLFMKSGGILLNNKGADPVDDWYKEIQYYNWSNPGYNALSYGHFTAVIWKGSTSLGIGRAVTSDNSTMYVAGNYFPGGNIIGT
ncbi:unnamed protein product, partial [Adineta steineri]